MAETSNVIEALMPSNYEIHFMNVIVECLDKIQLIKFRNV